jgi:hypothetical protein
LIAIFTAVVPKVEASTPHLDPAALWMGFGFFVIGILITMVSYFIRKQLECILENQKEYDHRQIACRETLADRFAEKAKTSEHIKELYHRTDKHEKRLAEHKVLIDRRAS